MAGLAIAVAATPTPAARKNSRRFIENPPHPARADCLSAPDIQLTRSYAAAPRGNPALSRRRRQDVAPGRSTHPHNENYRPKFTVRMLSWGESMEHLSCPLVAVGGSICATSRRSIAV